MKYTGRKKVVLTLAANFIICWLLLVVYLFVRGNTLEYAPHIAIGPIWYGIMEWPQDKDWDKLASLTLAGIVLIGTGWAIVRPRGTALFLAHCFWLLYWLWTFWLLSAVMSTGI